MGHEPIQILLKHAVVVQAKVFDKLFGLVIYTLADSVRDNIEGTGIATYSHMRRASGG